MLKSVDSGESAVQTQLRFADYEVEAESAVSNEITDYLKNLDVTTLTPIEALNELYNLQKKASQN